MALHLYLSCVNTLARPANNCRKAPSSPKRLSRSNESNKSWSDFDVFDRSFPKVSSGLIWAANLSPASICSPKPSETTRRAPATVPSHFCTVWHIYCCFTAIDTSDMVSTNNSQFESETKFKYRSGSRSSI